MVYIKFLKFLTLPGTLGASPRKLASFSNFSVLDLRLSWYLLCESSSLPDKTSFVVLKKASFFILILFFLDLYINGLFSLSVRSALSETRRIVYHQITHFVFSRSANTEIHNLRGRVKSFSGC